MTTKVRVTWCLLLLELNDFECAPIDSTSSSSSDSESESEVEFVREEEQILMGEEEEVATRSSSIAIFAFSLCHRIRSTLILVLSRITVMNLQWERMSAVDLLVSGLTGMY